MPASLHCLEGFRVSSIMTPMSRSWVTVAGGSPFILYSKVILLVPTCSTLHFGTLNNMHHLSDQLKRSLIVVCKFSLSSSVTDMLPNFVSSANFNIIDMFLVQSSRSFIKLQIEGVPGQTLGGPH